MGNTPIKPHIENAKKTGCFAARDMKLEEVPEALATVKTLRTLDLSGNKLKALPPFIGQYQHLKTLNLSKNFLRQIDDFMTNLKKLELINCSFNRLVYFPDEGVANLSNLKQVDLSNNQLKRFPSGLCQLKHLDCCNLSRNGITHWPENIGTIQALELNINQNQLTMIPDSLASAPRLKVLRVEENCIELGFVSIKLLKDSQVSIICFDGNLFGTKEFQQLEGYERYQERFTATKKKAM